MNKAQRTSNSTVNVIAAECNVQPERYMYRIKYVDSLMRTASERSEPSQLIN